MTFSGNSIDIDATPSVTEGVATRPKPTGKGGFFATLTAEQEARVMAYRGPETLADTVDLAQVLADAPAPSRIAP